MAISRYANYPRGRKCRGLSQVREWICGLAVVSGVVHKLLLHFVISCVWASARNHHRILVTEFKWKEKNFDASH